MSSTEIIEIREEITSDFDGTVIDIETIGDFEDYSDSRRYRRIRQVIFGCMDKHALRIFCAKGPAGISELTKVTKKILDDLERPLYAFNCDFETGVCFHHVGKTIQFDCELQEVRFEKKADSVRSLHIPNYDDPFRDNGFLCMRAWQAGNFDQAIAHNRACLLKERDILIRRGFRKAEPLNLIK